MSGSGEQRLDLVAVGNALVEITMRVADATIDALGLPKGRMTLASQTELDTAVRSIHADPEAIVPAGAECNVATGCSLLGGRSLFMGKVGHDPDGDFFAQSLTELQVATRLATGAGCTGRILSLVTPDRERTMMTCIGAASSFAPEDLDLAAIHGAQAAFVSAFSLHTEDVRRTALAFADEIAATSAFLALDLADALVVQAIPDVLSTFIEADRAEVILATAAEIAALQEVLGTDAITYLSRHASVVIVKCGEHGALAHDGRRVYRVAAQPASVVDTTGAGDAFASGFLMGRVQGYDLVRCLEFGARTAALAVSHFGSLLPSCPGEAAIASPTIVAPRRPQGTFDPRAKVDPGEGERGQ